MAEVPLTRGLVALVDDADLPLVSGYAWHAQQRSDSKGWYARACLRGSGRHSISMHRLLVPGAPRVDHKNGNGLDNRRSTGNLRQATGSQNNANQAKTRGTSRYKGVYWYTSRRRWRATIKHLSRTTHLGYFADENAAALAYNVEALRLWGAFARINEMCPVGVAR